MININYEWYGRNAIIKDIDNQVFKGKIAIITSKEDDEDNKDSLTLFDGENYIMFYDDEVADIELL